MIYWQLFLSFLQIGMFSFGGGLRLFHCYISENAQRGGNYYSGNARADIPFAEKREREKQEQRGDDP